MAAQSVTYGTRDTHGTSSSSSTISPSTSQSSGSLKLKGIPECPVTLQPMTDPMVDECGHSFDRTALVMIFNGREGPVSCPISRLPIHFSKMAPNYSLKETIEDLQKEALAVPATPPSLESLERMMMLLQNELRASRLEAAMREKAAEQRAIDAETNVNARIESVRAEMRQNIEMLRNDIRTLRRQTKLRMQQSTNLDQMSCCDRLMTLFCPSYIKTVMARGIAPEDIEFLEGAIDELLESSEEHEAHSAPSELIIIGTPGPGHITPSRFSHIRPFGSDCNCTRQS